MWLLSPHPHEITQPLQEEHLTVKLHSCRKEGPGRNWLVCSVAKYQFVSNCTFLMNKGYIYGIMFWRKGHTYIRTHLLLCGIPAYKNKGRVVSVPVLLSEHPEARAAQLWPFKEKWEKEQKTEALFLSLPNSHVHTSWSLGWDILITAWMNAFRSRHCVHV